MNSVGIDLHRRRSHVAVIDDEGTQLLSRRIHNDPETFLRLLAGLDGEGDGALDRAAAGFTQAQNDVGIELTRGAGQGRQAQADGGPPGSIGAGERLQGLAHGAQLLVGQSELEAGKTGDLAVGGLHDYFAFNRQARRGRCGRGDAVDHLSLTGERGQRVEVAVHVDFGDRTDPFRATARRVGAGVRGMFTGLIAGFAGFFAGKIFSQIFGTAADEAVEAEQAAGFSG